MRFLIKAATVVLVATALVVTAPVPPVKADLASGHTVLAIATISGSAGSLAIS